MVRTLKANPKKGDSKNKLQALVEEELLKYGYQFIERTRFEAALYLEQPIYSKQVPICKTIYETQAFCDFVLYHPQKHSSCLIIETKWQEKGGSVDEKYPYMVQNIKTRYPYETLLILDGGGYKLAAKKWLEKQVGEKLTAVMDIAEFLSWVETGNL